MRSPRNGSRSIEQRPMTGGPSDRGWWLTAVVAIWAAWFPVETSPLSGPVLAACLAVVVLWRWETGAASSGRRAAADLMIVLAVLAVSGAAGRDPARAVSQIALAAAVLVTVWAAHQVRPPRWAPVVIGVGLAGLALWAGWQELVGFGGLAASLDGLAGAEREYVMARIASGRPSASQLVPGHLAVLLATAVPLLIGQMRRSSRRGMWWLPLVLAGAGLLLTRSPLGLGLAVLAVGIPATRERARWLIRGMVTMLSIALAVVVWTRPDVARLEPLMLRVGNWRTAVAVWRETPAAGVGFGGFGQAAQTVDLDLENRPAHAHTVLGEGLAELGPVGLAAGLAVLAAIGSVAWRLRDRDPWLGAAIVVVPAHNLLDFSWWVSGVALPWAVLLGWALARLDSDAHQSSRSSRYDPVRIMVTACGAVAVAVALLHATSRWMEWSVEPSDPAARRVATFEQAWRLAPWRTTPALEAAIAALETDERTALERAARRLDRVAWLRPFSADVAAVRARVEKALGDEAAAAAALWNADRRRRVVDPTVSDAGSGTWAEGPRAARR